MGAAGLVVIPAKAGIAVRLAGPQLTQTPAFAGVTE
jgi:hypothetical protein